MMRACRNLCIAAAEPFGTRLLLRQAQATANFAHPSPAKVENLLAQSDGQT